VPTLFQLLYCFLHRARRRSYISTLLDIRVRSGCQQLRETFLAHTVMILTAMQIQPQPLSEGDGAESEADEHPIALAKRNRGRWVGSCRRDLDHCRAERTTFTPAIRDYVNIRIVSRLSADTPENGQSTKPARPPMTSCQPGRPAPSLRVARSGVEDLRNGFAFRSSCERKSHDGALRATDPADRSYLRTCAAREIRPDRPDP
jgi:hypothetical protein